MGREGDFVTSDQGHLCQYNTCTIRYILQSHTGSNGKIPMSSWTQQQNLLSNLAVASTTRCYWTISCVDRHPLDYLKDFDDGVPGSHAKIRKISAERIALKESKPTAAAETRDWRPPLRFRTMLASTMRKTGSFPIETSLSVDNSSSSANTDGRQPKMFKLEKNTLNNSPIKLLQPRSE